MIRNDADIASVFFSTALSLFDEIFVVDIQSTDGTKEILDSYLKVHTNIKIFSVDREEKFQAAMMNALSRKAFSEGADWTFFLDSDEFLDVKNRGELLDFLRNFPSSVMYSPWINLVPSVYGSFEAFDIKQLFSWSGRVSKYNKIAISRQYAVLNSDFYIHEGNHHIAKKFTSPMEAVVYGIPILHIPIRSLDRFRYKILNACRTLVSKENRLEGEGHHVLKIKAMIDQGTLSTSKLNYIAAHYGDFGVDIKEIKPIDNAWPKKTVNYNDGILCKIPNKYLNETMGADLNLIWNKTFLAKDALVMALINDGKIIISPQPMLGNGDLIQEKFKKLDGANPGLPKKLEPNLLIKAMEAAFTRIEHITFSAWSELVPALFAIFAVTSPRRYVELGSHNGMSFFGACQAANFLELDTQCVAIDSWVGDVHAGFHSTEVFNGFKKTLATSFSNQVYIKAFFSQALNCFEDGSIDLLHIDGLHTYEAVKDDFETWLPKMSTSGIIIFHDINVFERGFGVWRLWKELQEKYPSFALSHSHGLGILYVGNTPSILSELFEMLSQNRQNGAIVQDFLQLVDNLSVSFKTLQSQTAPHRKTAADQPRISWKNRELARKGLVYLRENGLRLTIVKTYRYVMGRI
jgi:glycosyltransferase involved in cell wall biosynthesis